MISEKDKKIVAAVFATKGVFPHDEDEEMSQIIMAKREFDGYSIGELQGGNGVITNEYWEFICTIEGYNQCLLDMARAEWMNNGVDCNYSLYKRRLQLKDIDTSNKELLVKHCDYTQDNIEWNDGFNFAVVFSDSVTQFKSAPRRNVYGQSNLIKFNKAFIFDMNYYKLVERKTPEQIKQDKLAGHLDKITDDIIKDHKSKGWEFDRSATSIDIAAAYELGYIVGPK